MIYTPTRKKPRRWFALLGALLGGFILYASTQPVAIPARSQLSAATGAVTWLGGDRYSTEFRLAGSSRVYAYATKGNEVGLVERALENGRSQSVTVLHGAPQADGPLGDQQETYPVYEIRVDDRTVRSYAEIKSAWESDNRVGIWVGIAMFVCAGLLIFTGVR